MVLLGLFFGKGCEIEHLDPFPLFQSKFDQVVAGFKLSRAFDFVGQCIRELVVVRVDPGGIDEVKAILLRRRGGVGDHEERGRVAVYNGPHQVLLHQKCPSTQRTASLPDHFEQCRGFAVSQTRDKRQGGRFPCLTDGHVNVNPCLSDCGADHFVDVSALELPGNILLQLVEPDS